MCLLRGRLGEAVAQWSARLPADDGKPLGEPGRLAAAVLARLHRAAGDAAPAVAAARRAGDPTLVEEMLLDAGDWRGLADAVAARPAPAVRAKQLGLLAGALHLAGDGPGFADAVARMRNIAKPQSVDDVAEVLILSGRAGQGLELLAGAGEATAPVRLRLLAAQERWDEAWKLVDAQDGARDEPALRLRVAAAEQWGALGGEKRAADLLARVAEENKTLNSASVHAALGDAYRKIDRRDESWVHFRAAFKLETEAKGDVTRILWSALRADVDDDGDADVNGINLWEFVRTRFRTESVDAQLDRAHAIADGTIRLEELKTMVPVGGRTDGQVFRAYAAGLPVIIAERMKSAGDAQGAGEFLSLAAERSPAPEYALQLYLRLGDWAADRQDWVQATDAYARAWNADRTRPAALYLRAWALRQAGYPAQAGELTSLAHTLPLADAWRRQEALRRLSERRLDAALAGEADVILRTGRRDTLPGDMAMRVSADRAARAGDWLAAANWHERATLNYMGVFDLADPVANLRIPHTVHRLRAKGLIEKGDVEGAEREIALCRALLPGDVMLPIDVVPALERAGKKARADELYAESVAAHDAALKRYPTSANHHNNAAWLAVNCGRDLDDALAHAKRAVELKPKNAAYIDTLAEVQFRRGEFDTAIASMRTCIELEPNTARHREQLERFEAGKRGEQRPMPPS
jgi:tetratricopeptide (TPR) repeat protein